MDDHLSVERIIYRINVRNYKFFYPDQIRIRKQIFLLCVTCFTFTLSSVRYLRIYYQLAIGTLLFILTEFNYLLSKDKQETLQNSKPPYSWK
jgi:hypothetical protein